MDIKLEFVGHSTAKPELRHFVLQVHGLREVMICLPSHQKYYQANFNSFIKFINS